MGSDLVIDPINREGKYSAVGKFKDFATRISIRSGRSKSQCSQPEKKSGDRLRSYPLESPADVKPAGPVGLTKHDPFNYHAMIRLDSNATCIPE